MIPACLISFMLLSPATPAVIWLDLFPLFFIKALQGFIALQPRSGLLTLNLFSDQIKAPCTRWDDYTSHQYNVLLVKFLSSMCTVVPVFRFTTKPTFFFLARRIHFTCFLHSAFSVPLHPVLHHLPFTTGCLVPSDLQSSANSSSGTWHVWNDGGCLSLHRQQIVLLLFSSGSLVGTVLRNLLKVNMAVADLVLGAWSPW